jgi:hypothetical protein
MSGIDGRDTVSITAPSGERKPDHRMSKESWDQEIQTSAGAGRSVRRRLTRVLMRRDPLTHMGCDFLTAVIHGVMPGQDFLIPESGSLENERGRSDRGLRALGFKSQDSFVLCLSRSKSV